MVDNPTKIYNDYVRANLPNSMSYDTGTDRYDINSHSFFKFKNSNWYFNYISKYGYSALSAYAVNNFEPALVFDFVGNYFRKSATASTFPASITHAATTNATMVDSDGLLKWRPHNLQVQSGDFSNSAWSKSAVTVDRSYVAPDGTSTASKLTSTGASGATGLYDSNPIGTGMSLTCFMKAGSSGVYGWIEGIVGGTSPYGVFDLESGTVVRSRECDASIESVGNGWFRCVLANTTNAISFFSAGGSDNTYSGSPWGSSNLTQDKFIYAWGAQLNRSDLGGMVNNPDAPTGLESYVPTTNTNVYLSRRGHHIYNGSAWVNEGILHESEARTNLLPNSSVLNYTKLNTATSTSTVVSPSGLQDAVLVQPTAASGTTWVYSLIYNTGVVTTISTFAKASGKSFVTMSNSNGNVRYASFNLTTGAVGTVTSGYTANIEDFGNGWYRCSVTTPTGFNERTIYAVSDTDGGIAAAANGNDGILLYGAQLEAGSTPSSYIPTTGSASVTRAAETLTVPAANLPYNSTNMSIQMDGKMTYADTGQLYEVAHYFWNLSSSNRIISALQTSGSFTGKQLFEQRGAGEIDSVTGTNTDYSPDINVPFNIASRHGSTFINGAHEGTLLTANTTPTTLPDLSSTDLDLGNVFMGTIGEFRMWSDDLGDVGITEATLPSTEPSLSLTFDGSETSFIVLDWSE